MSAMTIQSTTNAFFFIRQDDTPEKMIFGLAYELGQLLLQHSMQVGVIAEAREANRLARKFAAYFLMPANTIERTLDQIGVRNDGWSWELLLRIKHRYGVSAESFLYRLRELGRIEEEVYRELKQRIMDFYQETGHQEPGGSRRILNSNGRLWDLVMTAAQGMAELDVEGREELEDEAAVATEEVATIRAWLEEQGVVRV